MPDPDNQPLLSDAPIQRRNDDRFGRAKIAERIAVEARTAPADAGFVIALCGAWGSGKTSIGNMVAEAIEIDEDSVVVRCDSLEVVLGGAELMAMELSMPRDVPRPPWRMITWFRLATVSERE